MKLYIDTNGYLSPIATQEQADALISQGVVVVEDDDAEGLAALVEDSNAQIAINQVIKDAEAAAAAATAAPNVVFGLSLNMPSGINTTLLDKVSIVATSTANASTEQSYTFSSVFLAPPLVFVSVMGDDNEAQEVRVAVKNVTEGGCTVCVTRVSGHNNGATESVIVSLMAVGVIYALPL